MKCNFITIQLKYLSLTTWLGWTSILAQTTVETSVQSSAGSLAQLGTTSLITTLGQPISPGESTSGRVRILNGFIHTLDRAPNIEHLFIPQ
jgi:hypothetical protein